MYEHTVNINFNNFLKTLLGNPIFDSSVIQSMNNFFNKNYYTQNVQLEQQIIFSFNNFY